MNKSIELRKENEDTREEVEIKETETLDESYLGFCQTPEEVQQALKMIKGCAYKYYTSNPNLYRNNQLTAEDLEQTIHLHLMMKHRNSSGLSENKNGFRVTNFANLKTMCTMSMNAVLRGISMKKDIKKTVTLEDGTKEKQKIKTIQVSSLSELTNDNDNEEMNTNRINAIMSDGGNTEEDSCTKIQLNNFINKLYDKSPTCYKIFKINSFLNDNVNLFTREEEAEEVFKTFEDLLSTVKFNKKDNKNEIVPINKKVKINEIIKRVIYKDQNVEEETLKSKVNEYNKIYNEVCLQMRNKLPQIV